MGGWGGWGVVCYSFFFLGFVVVGVGCVGLVSWLIFVRAVL